MGCSSSSLPQGVPMEYYYPQGPPPTATNIPPEAPSGNEAMLDISKEQLDQEIAKECANVPDAFDAELASVRADYEAAKSRGEDFKLVGSQGIVMFSISKKLKGKKLRKQLVKAATVRFADDGFMEAAFERIWSVFDPQLEAQRPAGGILSDNEFWEHVIEAFKAQLKQISFQKFQSAYEKQARKAL